MWHFYLEYSRAGFASRLPRRAAARPSPGRSGDDRDRTAPSDDAARPPAGVARPARRRRCARSSAATCRCGCGPGTAPRPGRSTRRWSSCARPTPCAGCCGTRASSAPPRPTSPASSRSDGDLDAALTHAFAVAPRARAGRRTAVARRAVAARCARPSASARSAGRRPPPASQARVRGRLHSKLRDRRAISHHYDLSNEFYSLILDPSMAYSCGYYADDPVVLARGGAARQARPGLPQARPRAGHDAARRRLRLGLAVAARRRALRRAGHRRDHRGRAEEVHRRPDRRARPGGPGRDPAAGLPRGARARPLRRGRLDRDGRARRRAATTRRTPRCCTARCGPAAGCWSSRCRAPGTHGPGGGPFIESFIAPDMHMRPVGETVALPRARGARGARRARACASTTCAPSPAGWSTSRPTSTRLTELVGEEVVRVWRLYLVGGAMAFRDGRMGVDQILLVRPGGAAHAAAGARLVSAAWSSLVVARVAAAAVVMTVDGAGRARASAGSRRRRGLGARLRRGRARRGARRRRDRPGGAGCCWRWWRVWGCRLAWHIGTPGRAGTARTRATRRCSAGRGGFARRRRARSSSSRASRSGSSRCRCRSAARCDVALVAWLVVGRASCVWAGRGGLRGGRRRPARGVQGGPRPRPGAWTAGCGAGPGTRTTSATPACGGASGWSAASRPAGCPALLDRARAAGDDLLPASSPPAPGCWRRR